MNARMNLLLVVAISFVLGLLNPIMVQPVAAAPAPMICQGYTVKSGDTLYGIARKLGTTAQALATKNKISLSSTLAVGRCLSIPGRSVAFGGVFQPDPEFIKLQQEFNRLYLEVAAKLGDPKATKIYSDAIRGLTDQRAQLTAAINALSAALNSTTTSLAIVILPPAFPCTTPNGYTYYVFDKKSCPFYKLIND
jgi:LysM repeat protein